MLFAQLKKKQCCGFGSVTSATKGATKEPENETELFTRYFEEWKGVGKDKEESFQKIPRFYFKVFVIGLVI